MPKRPTGKRAANRAGYRVYGKAANGEGSIYPEGEGWRATWRDHAGKLHSIRGRVRDDVIRRRAEAIAAEDAIGPSRFDRATTVGELAAWWLETVARHRVRPSSFGKYVDRVDRFGVLAGRAVVDLRAEQVASWQAALLGRGLSAGTVADSRLVLRQVLDAAVDYGLVAANVVARVHPPKVQRPQRRALSAEDARALIAAARGDRFGAAVPLMFVQGWRVSEVLGLAWSDIDFRAGTATVRRAAVYVDGAGMQLGPTKTAGSVGVHHLAPGVLAALERRREEQRVERTAADVAWQTQSYERRPIDLVFTTMLGGLVNRQTIGKLVRAAAVAAGIDPEGVSTHTGRRTVVTTLYGLEGIDLADVARHVGHASPVTTAGYVRDLGERPKATAAAAASRLDSECLSSQATLGLGVIRQNER